LWKVTTLGLLG